MESSYINLDHLALNVTKRCNQRWIFCFEGDRKGWNEIDLKQIKEMVKSAIKRSISRIIFMGAETLLFGVNQRHLLNIIKKVIKLITYSNHLITIKRIQNKGDISPIVNKIAENKKETDIMQKRAELLRMYILREYEKSKG